MKWIFVQSSKAPTVRQRQKTTAASQSSETVGTIHRQETPIKFAFMVLPTELRAAVVNFCDRKTMINLSLACKSMHKEVEHLRYSLSYFHVNYFGDIKRPYMDTNVANLTPCGAPIDPGAAARVTKLWIEIDSRRDGTRILWRSPNRNFWYMIRHMFPRVQLMTITEIWFENNQPLNPSHRELRVHHSYLRMNTKNKLFHIHKVVAVPNGGIFNTIPTPWFSFPNIHKIPRLTGPWGLLYDYATTSARIPLLNIDIAKKQRYLNNKRANQLSKGAPGLCAGTEAALNSLKADLARDEQLAAKYQSRLEHASGPMHSKRYEKFERDLQMQLTQGCVIPFGDTRIHDYPTARSLMREHMPECETNGPRYYHTAVGWQYGH